MRNVELCINHRQGSSPVPAILTLHVVRCRVGVGQADYTSMEELDGDDVRLVNRAGKSASRDIVQFVPMRDFKGKSNHALAKEVSTNISLLCPNDTHV